ncbi:M48 family metallopeptidase [Candidatus Desantisbacteria bacterium]|nr:M48 family metallopeptidase [Candidatus Desantisbacteria bacterium]
MANIKIDQIIRSKRKTLSIEITHDARLIVRAPNATPLSFIEKFILKKRLWIQGKQNMVKEKHLSSQPKKFVSGEEFLYLGNSYCLCIVSESTWPLLFFQEFHLSRKYLSQARQLFIDWYKQEAYKKIKERVDLYSRLFGLKYNKFNITNAQKQWGSCNAKNNLCFSWRLIMSPLHIIDYVVIHELMHIDEKNHSRRFWNKVKTVIPNFKESRKWLKENGHLLVV